MCVCLESLPNKEGGRERVHCTMSRYSNAKLITAGASQYSNYIFDCSAISSSWFFFLLVIRGVPSLILAQTQVSAPLNSRPVDGYRKGGATPICIWSPA